MKLHESYIHVTINIMNFGIYISAHFLNCTTVNNQYFYDFLSLFSTWIQVNFEMSSMYDNIIVSPITYTFILHCILTSLFK